MNDSGIFSQASERRDPSSAFARYLAIQDVKCAIAQKLRLKGQMRLPMAWSYPETQ